MKQKAIATLASQNCGTNKSTEKPRRGRHIRKLVRVKVVKRTWLRTGSGTRLLSEEVVDELRDSNGRVVGGAKQRMIPRSRMGGGRTFRACEIASSRAGAGIESFQRGGAR